MPNQLAISVNSISKSFRLYNSNRDRFMEALHPMRKLYHHKFHALQDVSFQVEKGEVIGIIGQNGSGKSTLLKILASVLSPTSGDFKVNGKVTALLELGGGFNMELTGIENVYFLGAIQGYTKKEMHDRVRNILDFADIGEYAYQPVHSYSSGMYVRLAFSLAINIDPDILITDEALSVGDIRFQQKCFRRIREFKDNGKTILLCTHSLGTVREFCTRAIWIHKGRIMEQGDPLIVTDSFTTFMASQGATVRIDKPIPDVATNLNTLTAVESHFQLDLDDLSNCDSNGSGGATIQYASVYDRMTNVRAGILKGGEKLRVYLCIEAKEDIIHPCVHLVLNGQVGSPVFKIISNIYSFGLKLEIGKPEVIAIDFVFPKIGNGRYTFSFGVLPAAAETMAYMHWIHDGLIVNILNEDIRYKLGSQIVIDDAKIQMINK